MDSYKHISASIVADSENYIGERITTFVLKYPRYMHSELMTYRMFARNAQSSRAIPVKKRIEQVRKDPVLPILWNANQRGMQAKDQQVVHVDTCQNAWRSAATQAADHAELLESEGLHKQWTNRLLEPFDTITVIVTATDFSNMFGQRCKPDAQPEFQCLAWRMCELYYEVSTPTQTGVHLPFATDELRQQVALYGKERSVSPSNILHKVCVAKCARVSYLGHDGLEKSIDQELELYNYLVANNHFSPLEHCAIASPARQHGCLYGWKSMRANLPTDTTTFNYEEEKHLRPEWTK